MNGNDTTIEELITQLQTCNPKAKVRINVTHDLDVDLCQQGVIVGDSQTSAPGRRRNAIHLVARGKRERRSSPHL